MSPVVSRNQLKEIELAIASFNARTEAILHAQTELDSESDDEAELDQIIQTLERSIKATKILKSGLRLVK